MCPGDSTPQSCSYTATNHPSRKLSKLDEPDTRNTAGEIGTSSCVMYSCGSLHMDEQRQGVQLKRTYSSSVPIRDVALRTCRKQWMKGRGGERGSRISMRIAWHGEDNNDKHKLRIMTLEREKVIHWYCVKKLKFDHASKWYMHKLESVQEKETNTILCEL